MNPILLKPSSDVGAQVVAPGKAIKVMSAREYHQYQPHLIGVIRESFQRLLDQHDIVVMEGAGSPAEINLRPFDIVNMATARMASAPVVLVGDINLGGVFASLVETLELLTDEERSLIKAFIINKFRGDISLLRDGLEFLEKKPARKFWACCHGSKTSPGRRKTASPIPNGKGLGFRNPAKLRIRVILLPHVSNSTDFESLELEPDVGLRYLADATTR